MYEVARKATDKNEKKKKQKLEWLLPISSTGSRPSVEVVTGRQQVHRAGAAARAVAGTTAPACTHDLSNAQATWAKQGKVATWVAVGEVATWIFGVAIWKSHYGQKRGRDMKLMSRHRSVSKRVATWFRCRDLAWGWAGEKVSRPHF